MGWRGGGWWKEQGCCTLRHERCAARVTLSAVVLAAQGSCLHTLLKLSPITMQGCLYCRQSLITCPHHDHLHYYVTKYNREQFPPFIGGHPCKQYRCWISHCYVMAEQSITRPDPHPCPRFPPANSLYVGLFGASCRRQLLASRAGSTAGHDMNPHLCPCCLQHRVPCPLKNHWVG